MLQAAFHRAVRAALREPDELLRKFFIDRCNLGDVLCLWPKEVWAAVHTSRIDINDEDYLWGYLGQHSLDGQFGLEWADYILSKSWYARYHTFATAVPLRVFQDWGY